ncbi:MAG: site-2 protease family protein [Betaproteobacteria bacterium]|nr:site-2 protease family protein [Betaproteobacteria bacterium]
MSEFIQTASIWALPVIFAITLHEAAHGYVAKHFGDLTAHAQGRVSLNPLRHIDPMGTIVVPLLLLAISKISGGPGILFGWAKPVPVNFGKLRNPKRDMLWVAAAGPGANLLMAVFWALVIKVAVMMPDSSLALPMTLMGKAGIEINVVLMVLNLLPVPPLDGGRIAVSLLPHRLAWQFSRIEPYGFMILIVLIFTGVLWAVIGPVIVLTIYLLQLLLGV